MTDERKTRVHRSLREMENSANELADFLDDQRSRRRTVEIIVNQGDRQRCLTVDVDQMTPDDNGMLRFNSKGSLCSGGSGRSSPVVRDGEPTPTSVDTQAARWEKHHERRTKQRKKVIQPEPVKISQSEQRNENEKSVCPNLPPVDIDQTEDIVTRLRRRLDEKKKRNVPDIPTKCNTPPTNGTNEIPHGPEETTKCEPECAQEISRAAVVTPVVQSVESSKIEIKNSETNSDSDPNSDSGISYNSAVSLDRADLTPLNFNLREIDELDDLALSQPSDEQISVNHQSDSEIHKIPEISEIPTSAPVELKFDTVTCSTEIPVTEFAHTTSVRAPELAHTNPAPELARATTAATREVIMPSKYHNESYHEADTMIADECSFNKIDLKNSDDECEKATEENSTEQQPEVEPEVPKEPEKQEPEPTVEDPIEEPVKPVEPKVTVTQTSTVKAVPEESSMPKEPEKPPGSVNDRLATYKNKTTENAPPKVAEKAPVGKISSIDKFKQNYLNKADAPSSGNSTPTTEATVTAVTPPGTMSLRERMKMFENKGKSDRVLQRETVGQTERASNIRNKISLWGKSNNNNDGQLQREKIHVGSIDDRRSQYNSLAKI